MIPYKIDERFEAPAGRYYRHALFETLKYLRPQYCLEIGTNHGASTTVFQRYFDEYMEEGWLITCDIKIYNKFNLPNVSQLQVHSWIDNPSDWHVVKDEELLHNDNRSNLQIIIDEMKEVGIPNFDLIFIDGDHTEVSVKADMLMCSTLPHSYPRYTLLDDTDNKDHDVSRVYTDVIKKNKMLNTYDYDNWEKWVGASLIWEKELNNDSE